MKFSVGWLAFFFHARFVCVVCCVICLCSFRFDSTYLYNFFLFIAFACVNEWLICAQSTVAVEWCKTVSQLVVPTTYECVNKYQSLFKICIHQFV